MPCVLEVYKKYMAVAKCKGKSKYIGSYATKAVDAQAAVKAQACVCVKHFRRPIKDSIEEGKGLP